MFVLKRISKGSAARVFGLMGAAFGFFYGLTTVAVMQVLIGTGIPLFAALRGLEQSIGIATILMFPLAFGVGGASLGILISGFYNMISHFTGGLRFDIDVFEQENGELKFPKLKAPKLKRK